MHKHKFKHFKLRVKEFGWGGDGGVLAHFFLVS